MKWMLNPGRADFEGMAKQYGISQLIAKIMVNRGIDSPGKIEMFLHGTMDDLHSPMLLKDMDKAVAMLKRGIEAGKKYGSSETMILMGSVPLIFCRPD